MSRRSIVRSCVLLSAVAVMLAVVGVARAEVIVSDTFSNVTDVTAVQLNGRTPETTLSGGVWTKTNSRAVSGQEWYISTTMTGNPTPGTAGQTAGSDAVSIASNGSYVKPSLLHISADIELSGISGDVDNAVYPRGIGLGFYLNADSTVGTGNQNVTNSFVGLLLDRTGALALIYDPNKTGYLSGPGVYKSAAVEYAGGTFSASNFYNLSYDVNTTTGQISNIALEGSTADYSLFSTTAYFTDANTPYAGMLVSSAAGNTTGYADNFQVTGAVPEPSTLALLVAGLFGLLAYAWRKRK